MSAVSGNDTQVSESAVAAATGKEPGEWFLLLDAAGASEWDHARIARWLVSEQGVDGWWAQGITVRYEQARGLRLPGQKADGSFEVSVSRRLVGDQGAVLDRLIEAFSQRFDRAPASVRRESKYQTARWKFDDGLLLATVSPTAGGKSSAAMTHSKIGDPADVAPSKARLAEVLDTLVGA